jgi:CBS-domain-containing membrane protein
MNPESALPGFRVDRGTTLAQRQPPTSPPVTAQSPALDVVTDLTSVKAATAPPASTLAQCEQAMITQGVRMLFVTAELPAIEGIVTTTDLHGERQMRLVAERGLRWNDLTVADVMTPLDSLDAIDFDALRSATVNNLVATLKRFGRNHVLVVQAATAQTPLRVRGIVSRAQIERQLGTPIELTEIARTFAEIEQALHSGTEPETAQLRRR